MNGSECPAEGLQDENCMLSAAEVGERDALSAVRMMVSLLSILGTSAVIASIIRNRLTWSPTIQPILQLSIADWLQGIMWVVGACLWFRGTSHRASCYIVSVLTVILECVAANLTLVYAILAYTTLRKHYKRNAMDTVYSSTSQVWHPVTSVLVYLTAWALPVVIIVPVFASLIATAQLWGQADECTCWCFPHVGNVLPFSTGRDLPSATYLWHVRKLITAYSGVLLLNYLIVFILMAILYREILRIMWRIRRRVAEFQNDVMNEAVKKTQARARERILYFLLIFLIMALSTVILAIVVLYFNGQALREGITVSTSDSPSHHGSLEDLFIHLFQSLMVPLQGFLNAVVYGRTRDDFVHMMASTARFFANTGSGKAEMHYAHDIVSDEGDEEEGEGEEGTQSEKELLYSRSFSNSPVTSDAEN